MLPNAKYISLGKIRSVVMEKLVADEVLKESQVLLSMPHPSMSNGKHLLFSWPQSQISAYTGKCVSGRI